MRTCLLIIIFSFISLIFAGFNQQDQAAYLQAWSSISQYSYQESLPPQLTTSCKANTISSQININFPVISLSGAFDSSSFQTACGTLNLCVLTQGSTLIMNGNLNVAALKILGTVYWNDTSQTQPFQWLCAGYVVVESNGAFKLSLNSLSLKAYVYLKNNGAVHPNLRTRVFGGYNTDFSITGPTIDVTGRTMKRTWSLLYKTVPIGSNKIQLIHNPADMGWQVGDRIVIAPTTSGSKGNAEGYYIKAINTADNSILLDMELTKQAFSSYILREGTSSSVALMSAEVINLSRNVIITGDDFNHVTCDPTLTLTKGVNDIGCACDPSIGRTVCTMGLNTIMAGKGIYKIQYSRIEKCGQRGIFSKYCLHFHKMGVSPQSLLRGNAIENSQQRGIIVHDTHLVRVEENVLNDVRGTGIYLQDGNEMYNQIMYNVVVCPTAKDGPLGGCTIPGTDNGQSDTSLNQAGLWANSRTNDMVGNRFSNSFNGMFYDLGNMPLGVINPLNSIMGRVEGNTFHGHGRFGTYILEYYPQSNCIGDINNDGLISAACQAFTSTGLDNGYAVVLLNNVDYDNVFVGGYNVGDVEYQGHVAINNNNNVYWKECKNFADGCSAHISNSYYSDGNMALPDSAAFIIENTVVTGRSSFETNHHCNIGTTGFLCMPTYVFLNVSVRAMSLNNWVQFHQEANNYGGILVLSPPEASNPIGARGFFPPTYQSLVSFYYSYLLGFGSAVCEKAININNAWPGVPTNVMNNRYQGGIFCRKPVRSLKIYTNGLSKATAYGMSVEVWQGTTLVTSFVATYHQTGSDFTNSQLQSKQGYAFPVIADTNYEYRLSMINSGAIKYPNGNLPSDWIVEFSDPVFGNRWTPDKIILTVRGQGCDKKLVTSQHDRRWVWFDTRHYPSSQAWGRGACNSANPDMPTVTCPAVPKSIPNLACDGQCSSTCQNGYCDCGSKQCVCNPGFSGPSCSLNICDAARCGSHGRCIATYLGGDLLPSQGTCVCDQGWSGPNCDQNVCSGVTCSGRGYCQAKGDTDHQCICDSSYFGFNCEKVKQDSCSICPSNFMSVCNVGDDFMTFCLAGSGSAVGCDYPKTYTPYRSGFCCYANCEKCDLVNCPSATNDCHLSGACNPLDGTCGAQTQRTDGSPCNSIPYGVCQQGVCQASALTTSRSPSYAPSTSNPAGPNYQYLGCYGDNVARAMKLRLSSKVNSILDCYNLALSNRSTIFGLQYGGECWVSNDVTKATSYGLCGVCTSCGFPACNCANMKCLNGDDCGDGWANNLYTITSLLSSPSPSITPSKLPSLKPSVVPSVAPIVSPTYLPIKAVDYQYLGCYGDNVARAMKLRLSSKVNSILDCYNLALSNRSTIFGLQYGGECWVSNDVTKATSYGLCGVCTSCGFPACNCANMKCLNGDDCGDGWANNLYTITSLLSSPSPSITPSKLPSIKPTIVPSLAPVVTSSMTPSKLPSLKPSVVPSVAPTVSPSTAPSKLPSRKPSVVPSVAPTVSPSTAPSKLPSLKPSVVPSGTPVVTSSTTPSKLPSLKPSVVPSVAPTVSPSTAPSKLPSLKPSVVPSVAPTVSPSTAPSKLPSLKPSVVPSGTPVVTSSATPSKLPSLKPSVVPSVAPTVSPSTAPSKLPSLKPSVVPSGTPIVSPTYLPIKAVDYQYLGCYGDNAARSMKAILSKKVNSILDCYNLALSNRSTIFGLQYGGECWVSNDVTKATSYGLCGVCTSCGFPACNCANMKCLNGDDCGDGWANNLYTITSLLSSPSPSITPSKLPSIKPTIVPSEIPSISPTYFPTKAVSNQYLGCYGDNAARSMEKQISAKVNSVNDCYHLALSNGYSVYGLQYGGECWVSNDVTKATSYGLCGVCTSCGFPACNCANMKCLNGDDCGDGWANSLYKITSSGISTTPPFSQNPSIRPSAKPSTKAIISSFKLTESYNYANFFNNFDFQNIADPTHGTVEYVNSATAFSSGLAKSTHDNKVYIGVDSTATLTSGGRKAIRLKSKRVLNGNVLVVIDLDHMPTTSGNVLPKGCSVWPAFWTVGSSWPNNGEIDIIEYVNTAKNVNSALHSSNGCSMHSMNASTYTGKFWNKGCWADDPEQISNVGCSIDDSGSVGSTFNSQNGGVYVLEWVTDKYIRMFHFPRGTEPKNLMLKTPDPNSWGLPYARFDIGTCGSSCSSNHFQNHNIIFNTALCGDWAGSVFSSTCSSTTTCTNFVYQNPAEFKEAYWLVNYIDIYDLDIPTPVPVSSPIQSPVFTPLTYDLASTYDASNFFDNFKFDNRPDPTHGTVNYVDYATAANLGLAKYMNNKIYMGVDSSTVLASGGRNSIRIKSNRILNGNNLIIVDLDHMPSTAGKVLPLGCSVWPAFWTYGPSWSDNIASWPTSGEIDIIEYVNRDTTVASALHTSYGCDQYSAAAATNLYTGISKNKNCYVNAPGQSTNSGCGFTGPSKSVGAAFNTAGGGVYAMEWDTRQHIRMFYFPRGSIPQDIQNKKPVPSSWGLPYARFEIGSECEGSKCPKGHFSNHNLVFDTTLCGDWAGNVFGSCSTTMTCSAFVRNYPSEFTEAYWLINYVDIYDAPTTLTKKYLGCYGDASTRALETRLATSVSSIQECQNLAVANGYNLFGLQNGGECRVSNSLSSATKYGLCGQCASKGCKMPACSCSAQKCKSGEDCGDSWANAVYQIEDSKDFAAIKSDPSISTDSDGAFLKKLIGGLVGGAIMIIFIAIFTYYFCIRRRHIMKSQNLYDFYNSSEFYVKHENPYHTPTTSESVVQSHDVKVTNIVNS